MTTATVKTLGIDVSNSPLELIDTIRKGLKKEAVDRLSEALEIGPPEISRFLHISPRTLHRYKPGETLSLDVSDHLFQVFKVYERAVEVFGGNKKALRWLKYPSLALGNTAPLDLLDTSAGVEMVVDELGRIEYGVFA